MIFMACCSYTLLHVFGRTARFFGFEGRDTPRVVLYVLNVFVYLLAFGQRARCIYSMAGDRWASREPVNNRCPAQRAVSLRQQTVWYAWSDFFLAFYFLHFLYTLFAILSVECVCSIPILQSVFCIDAARGVRPCV